MRATRKGVSVAQADYASRWLGVVATASSTLLLSSATLPPPMAQWPAAQALSVARSAFVKAGGLESVATAPSTLLLSSATPQTRWAETRRAVQAASVARIASVKAGGCATLMRATRKGVSVAQADYAMYRLRVLGQWFDGIRFYAAASSPRRSRRTWAGLR